MDKRHLRALTGIRGIAAFWVVLHHLPYVPLFEGWKDGPLGGLIDFGWLGVDLFFVLSGFVISYVHAEEFRKLDTQKVKRFLVLRLARIYPVHLVTTLAFIPLAFMAQLDHQAVFEGKFGLEKLAYSVFLLNGWGIPGSNGYNLPSWSVSAEWFAYLIFPFLTAVGTWRLKTMRGFLASIVIILAVMTGLAVGLNESSKYILDWEWTLTRIFSEFLIGCLLFRVFTKSKAGPVWDRVALFALAGILLHSCLMTNHFYDFLLIILFGVLVLALALSVGLAERTIGSRVMVYLGQISYSTYLTHSFVLIVFKKALERIELGESLTAQIGVFTLICGAVVLVSHFTFKWIEEPGRKRLRNLVV